MAKKTISITGTSNKTYDLNAIEQDSRTNSSTSLVVEVHKYKAGENPNPDNLTIGQIWVSSLIK